MKTRQKWSEPHKERVIKRENEKPVWKEKKMHAKMHFLLCRHLSGLLDEN